MTIRGFRSAALTAFLSLALAGCMAEFGEVDDEALEDGEGDADLETLAVTSCASERSVFCQESDNNCSYPQARACDPLPRALDRVDRSPFFPIVGANQALQDSRGHVLGVVTATETKLNFGQRRLIKNTRKVMAFSVATTNGTRTGWIDESAIGRDLAFMPSVVGRDPGGSYSTWRIVPSDNTPYLDGNGNSLKVVATCESGRNATDYLGRNGHANLIFNLPGYSPALGSGTIDSYANDAGIHFDRAKAQRSLERPLFSCASGSPVRTDRTLSFLYGRVVGAEDRHGWIAMPNLRPGS